MLVLSRRPGEQVVIPDCDMTITIVAVEGNNVRLGFTAPRQVGIHRREVLEKKIESASCSSAAAQRNTRGATHDTK